MPSDSDYATPPTDRRMCGGERVPFSGEVSSSVPSPVKELKFEKQGGLRSRALSALPTEAERSVRVQCNAYPPLHWPPISVQ